MKRKDMVLAFLVLLAATGFFWFGRAKSREVPETVRITVGEEVYEYPLGEERLVTFSDNERRNVVKLEEDGVLMESSDCPDRTCVWQGKLKDGNGQIVCLPNRVVIELVGAPKTVDSVVY